MNDRTNQGNPFRLLIVLAILSASFPTLGQEENAKAKSTNVAVVPLLEGAETPEKAVGAYMNASAAGDADAAFLMLDPQVRELFEPEIAVMETDLEADLLELIAFDNPNRKKVGFSFLFADRDLVRIESSRILKKLVVREDCVVFSARCEMRGYGGDGKAENVLQVLTIRRGNRWFVFRSIGFLTRMLMDGVLPEEDGDGLSAEDLMENQRLTSILKLEPSKATRSTERPGYEERYLVPIETVHAALVNVAKIPKIRAGVLRVRNAQRYLQSLRHRLKRGDITDRDEYLKAAKPVMELCEEVWEEHHEVMVSALGKLSHLRAKTDK
jgi:hypothetical protein